MKSEEKVSSFYNGVGWDVSSEGHTTDAELFEDLRPCADEYVRACRRRLLRFLPKSGDFILDAASGPIQYPEYLEYSKGFKKRVCVDISQKALDVAKRKMGEQGETVCSNILELPFGDNYFDAVVSLHTIYHIESDKQAEAVKQLIRVAKPGAPVVIVYGNPSRLLARLKRMVKTKAKTDDEQPLYYFCHPLEWWKKFEGDASVEIFCWRSLTAKDAQRFIPDNFLGKGLLKAAFFLEDTFSRTASHLGAYPVVVLKKH